ncbi:GNAT family N-acetyltransferase [Jatrophihabitans lederbergiae]|uniref:GNAT family N-acetyltransferase n=1 Tax=Jatrophihabitans lederbergiae TaxID=3075547 RepID=A0ABU2J516_9ACTN|nr:GNAT family N-acetyltransferase [Jatrophihabitans sp. DSM 44399]MDT0260072.1 GNAT family N-acetyltransferase [Jatrophihabitans sp. DSM 44399]
MAYRRDRAPDPHPKRVRLVRLGPDVLELLAAGDLDGASRAAAAPLTGYFTDPQWGYLWSLRREQLRHDPASADWIARAVLDEDRLVVVGHAGYHGPPDEAGLVEVGYAIDPAYRRQGYGRAALAALLQRATAEPAVRTVRATISPDNLPSRLLVSEQGLRQVGEQWDDRDGLELVFEVAV